MRNAKMKRMETDIESPRLGVLSSNSFGGVPKEEMARRDEIIEEILTAYRRRSVSTSVFQIGALTGLIERLDRQSAEALAREIYDILTADLIGAAEVGLRECLTTTRTMILSSAFRFGSLSPNRQRELHPKAIETWWTAVRAHSAAAWSMVNHVS
jgi:hypothetical protein